MDKPDHLKILNNLKTLEIKYLFIKTINLFIFDYNYIIFFYILYVKKIFFKNMNKVEEEEG